MTIWVPIVSVVIGAGLGFFGQFLLARQQAMREREAREEAYRRQIQERLVERVRDHYQAVAVHQADVIRALLMMSAHLRQGNDPYFADENRAATDVLRISELNSYRLLVPLRLDGTNPKVLEHCQEFDGAVAAMASSIQSRTNELPKAILEAQKELYRFHKPCNRCYEGASTRTRDWVVSRIGFGNGRATWPMVRADDWRFRDRAAEGCRVRTPRREIL